MIVEICVRVISTFLWIKNLGLWIVRSIFSTEGITKISIFLAAISIVQSQDALVQEDLNHSTKVLSFENSGLAPVHLRIFAIKYDLNYDKETDPAHPRIKYNDPVSFYSTRGWVLPNGGKWLWPYFGKERIDLKNSTSLEFNDQKFDDARAVYCLAIEERNLLNNKVNTDVMFTTDSTFLLSTFGLLPKGASSGGSPQGINQLFNASDIIKQLCLKTYELEKSSEITYEDVKELSSKQVSKALQTPAQK